MKQKYINIGTSVFLAMVCVMSFASAQIASTTTGASANTVVSSNGDTLCTLSNGNKIPCEFVTAAETDIADGDAITSPNGDKVCRSELGVYLNCTMLNSDGTFKPEYSNEKSKIKAYILWQQVKAGQAAGLVAGAVLILLAIIAALFFIAKKKKNNHIITS